MMNDERGRAKTLATEGSEDADGRRFCFCHESTKDRKWKSIQNHEGHELRDCNLATESAEDTEGKMMSGE